MTAATWSSRTVAPKYSIPVSSLTWTTFSPTFTTSVAIAMVWAWIFNVQYGVFNYFLEKLGIERLQWLQEPRGLFEVLANRMGVTISGVPDFLLKQQVVELFAFFDELQNGVIDVLEIKHGLPFRMVVREVAA